MIRRPIQYISSTSGNCTGIIRATKFYKGNRYSKTFSWHCRKNGRTEEDALNMAYEFLDIENDIAYCQLCRNILTIGEDLYEYEDIRICNECNNSGF